MAGEHERLEMYEALKEAIGVGPATTLVDSVPPFGWREVATKQDLRDLEDRLTTRVESMLHRELREAQQRLFFGMLASQAAFAALVIGLG